MNTKLTLTIKPDLVRRAKHYAKKKNRSLSDIIENYLKVITQEDENTQTSISSKVRSLRGSFKAPEDFDYKNELIKGLSDKYL